MPETPRDPLLERPGVGAVAKHVLVVVELEQEGRRVPQKIDEAGFGAAEVGGDDDPRPLLFEGIGDRFVRVVRGCERAEPELPDPALAPRLDADKRREEVALEPDRVRRSDRRENRAFPAGRKDESTARVVAVPVRY